MENLRQYSDQIMAMAISYAPKIIGALIVFILGLWLTNFLAKLTSKAMQRRKLDVSLQSFLSSLVNVGLKLLLLVTVAGMVGIQTTSFVAVLGAAGLAVGLALQGSLANFAGGVLILIFKPYKVGDIIESGGQTGAVQEIQIFNTVLLTPENKTVILPNGAVSNGTIVNYSRHGNLRVDLTIAIAPSNDVVKARQVIEQVFATNPKVLKEPAPGVTVLNMDNGMTTLAVRPYATPADYWDVYFGVQEQIKTAFEENKISAPIPHRVVISKQE